MIYNRTFYVQHGSTYTLFEKIVPAVEYWACTLGSVLLYTTVFYGEPKKYQRLDLGFICQILEAQEAPRL